MSEKTVSVAAGSCLLGMLGWIPRHKVLFHREGIGYGDSPLSGLFHGFPNSINIDPTKIRPEYFIVWDVIVDNLLVGPENMLIGLDG